MSDGSLLAPAPGVSSGGVNSGIQSPSASKTARAPGVWRARAQRLLAADEGVLVLAVLYFLALLPVAPALANPENLQLILSNMLPLLAVVLGQTFVLVTGGIDLSVTSTIALASVAGAMGMVTPALGLSGVPALLLGAAIMLLVGGGVGLVNGLAITRLSMPPFMVTLATMMFVSGAAIWLTRSNGIPGLPEALAVLSQEGVGFVPYALFVVAPLAWVAHRALTRTMYGRWLFAVGRNVKAARVSGVPVSATVVTAYVLCGLCAAVAALLYTGRLETGSPVLGQRIFLDVIGAAVIGGVSLFGGKGRIAGAVYGVLFITLIDNSLNILGFSSFTVLMAKGTVILFAALFDAMRMRRMVRTT